MLGRSSKSSSELRTSKRTRLFVTANVMVNGESRPARLRDLSSVGARVELRNPPAAGIKVRLLKGQLAADGVIKWASANACGIAFEAPIQLLDWLSTTTDGRRSNDNLSQSIHSRLDKEIPAPPTIDDPDVINEVLMARIADELGYLSRIIESVCLGFVKDPVLLSRYQIELQSLDLTAISLQQIAALVGATDMAHAALSISQASLKSKLLRVGSR